MPRGNPSIIRPIRAARNTAGINVLSVISVYALIILISMDVMWASPPPVDHAEITPQELQDRIQSSETAIRSFEVHMEMWLDKTTKERSLRVYDWGFQDGAEYLNGQYTVTKEDGDPNADLPGDSTAYRQLEQKTAFDGKVLRIWMRYVGADKSTGRITSFESKHFHGLPTPATLLGHRLFYPKHQSLSATMSQARSVVIHPTLEEVNGHPCYVVDIDGAYVPPHEPRFGPVRSYDVRVWIDPNRGWRPLRMETSVAKDGQHKWKCLMYRADDMELQKIDGIWVPVAGTYGGIKTQMRLPLGTSEEEFAAANKGKPFAEVYAQMRLESTPSTTWKMQAVKESVRVNHVIPQESFTFEFPNNTVLYDDFLGKGWVVGTQEAEGADTAGSAIWGWMGLAALMIAGVIAVVLRRRRVRT